MLNTFRLLFILLFTIGCLKTKKSPFDLNTSTGSIGAIGFTSILDGGIDGKSITSFELVTPSVTGTISNTSITVTVPPDTNLTNLVAVFTTTGTSVQIGSTVQTSGVTPNDFTNPVTYTVLASDNTTKDYTVTVVFSQVGNPTFSVGTGTYNNDQNVIITTSTSGATIYFNRGTNPADPDCSGSGGTSYSGPITVDSTGTIIKAIACKAGIPDSSVSSATYTLKVAPIYPNSNNDNNRIVTPYTFTGSSAPVEVTKCLSYTLPPSCNTDGNCINGTTNLEFSSLTENVTVQARGCRVNYLPSDIQTKTFTVSARRSSDNVYLTVVDPDSNDALLNKKIYICSEGETYNTTTGNCQGVANEFQFCANNDNTCNGGTDTGLANNASTIFTFCESKSVGGLTNWRVPTRDELNAFFAGVARSPNGFPSTSGADIWSNQSVLSGFANTVYYTYPSQVNILQTQKTFARKLRCIHD